MVADEPIAAVRMATVLALPTARVEALLDELAAEYAATTAPGRAASSCAGSGDGWRIYSAPAYADVVGRFVLDGQSARLTQAALETLAVIAYRQPVTRGQVSAVRGVNVDGVVRTLTTRGLIAEIGPDRPAVRCCTGPRDTSWSGWAVASTSCLRWRPTCRTSTPSTVSTRRSETTDEPAGTTVRWLRFVRWPVRRQERRASGRQRIGRTARGWRLGASRGGSAGGYRGGSTGGSGGGYRGAGGGEGYRGSTGGGEGYRGGSTGGSRGGEGYRGGSTGGSAAARGTAVAAPEARAAARGTAVAAPGGRAAATPAVAAPTGTAAVSAAGGSRDSGGYRGGRATHGGGYRGGVPGRRAERWRLARCHRWGLRGGPGAPSRSGAPRPKSGTGYPRSGGTGRPRTDGASSRPKKPSRTPEVTIDVHDPDGVRLQKVLAAAGLGSRRSCEDLISAGRVTVDGNKVLELGVRVDPLTAVIHVDGMRVQLDSSIITIALNKPKGVVSTMHDPEGRPSIGQFVSDREERLFHVGRLDAETEGLILLTNDGDLANRLSHPSHGVTKVYLVQLEGRVTPSLGARLIKGVELEDGLAKVDKFQIVQTTPQASLVEIELHEGRNRIVRRIFDEVGYPVTQLVRTQIGPIRLGDLKPGRTRVLSKTEVGSLMTRVGM